MIAVPTQWLESESETARYIDLHRCTVRNVIASEGFRATSISPCVSGQLEGGDGDDDWGTAPKRTFPSTSPVSSATNHSSLSTPPTTEL